MLESKAGDQWRLMVHRQARKDPKRAGTVSAGKMRVLGAGILFLAACASQPRETAPSVPAPPQEIVLPPELSLARFPGSERETLEPPLPPGGEKIGEIPPEIELPLSALRPVPAFGYLPERVSPPLPIPRMSEDAEPSRPRGGMETMETEVSLLFPKGGLPHLPNPPLPEPVAGRPSPAPSAPSPPSAASTAPVSRVPSPSTPPMAPKTPESPPTREGGDRGDKGPALLPQSPASALPSPPPSQQLRGEVGRNIRVVLPGIGWIYLGEKDGGEKVRYVSKETAGDTTVFVFSVTQEGETVLQFQQQDLLAQTTRYDSVSLSTAAPATAAAPGRPRSNDPNPVAPSTQPVLSPSHSPSAPSRDSRELISQEPSPPPPAKSAESGPVTVLPEYDPSVPLSTQVEQWLSRGRKKEVALFLERFVTTAEGRESQELDRWYFTLAKLHETEAELKDMKKALLYYERVRDQFPFSPYWEEADNRSRYIRRNFFDIR